MSACYLLDIKYYAFLLTTHLHKKYALAIKLVDFLKEVGVRRILFVGGEPTFWKPLFNLIEYITSKGMSTLLVTNGYLLSKGGFLEKIKNSTLTSINISIKAGTRDQHIDLTGKDYFGDVLKGIENISKIDSIESSVSMTINSLMVDNLEDAVLASHEAGTKQISLDFCTTVFEDKKPIKGYMVEPKKMVAKIVDIFEDLDTKVNGKLYLAQSYPKCIWPLDFIEKLLSKNKVAFGCHVYTRNGIIFTKDGQVLLCNLIPDYPIGKFGIDFTDKNSFFDYLLDFLINHLYVNPFIMVFLMYPV